VSQGQGQPDPRACKPPGRAARHLRAWPSIRNPMEGFLKPRQEAANQKQTQENSAVSEETLKTKAGGLCSLGHPGARQPGE